MMVVKKKSEQKEVELKVVGDLSPEEQQDNKGSDTIRQRVIDLKNSIDKGRWLLAEESWLTKRSRYTWCW